MNVTLRKPPAASKRPSVRSRPEPWNLPAGAPHISVAPTYEIALIAEPAGRQSEAIRTLRTHILTSHRQRGRRALVVCAASRGEGCTRIAVNLAVALSQIGLKVLLIDADLRQPSAHRYFPPIQGAPGLYDRLLNPDAPLGRSIVADAETGLSVMPAGNISAEAPDLLSIERLRPLLDACQREFDATIIDTPPANVCSDARLISSVAGYSLIVAKDNTSFVGDVKALANELRGAHAHIVGAVLSEA
jgi:protein-tyrosine kinase